MLHHNSRVQGLRKGRNRHGQYIVAHDSEHADFLTKWIASGDFMTYEDEQFCLSSAEGRARNILYGFHLPGIQTDVVMKVLHISPRYRLLRKIDLFITGLYKDYCKISFYSAMALYFHDLPVAKPLAFWTFKQGIFSKKSYFLCYRLPGKQSVKQLLGSLQANDLDYDFYPMARKLAVLVRNIHAAGLRHGDLHTGNILADATELEMGQSEGQSDFMYFLVDYERCSKVRIKTPWIKILYDLKDLSRLVIPTVDDETLLEMYFGSAPSPYSIGIFKFWKKGGINLRQRLLGLPPKKDNRHLVQ